MIWLSNSTLAKLRDLLRTQGQRPSVVLAPGTSPDELEFATCVSEFGPLCEAMYLMMSADGQISADEREVLKGALRSLSEGNIRSVHIESMLDQAASQAAAHGRDKRLEEVSVGLADDPARAEVAFVLAAAIAFADSAIADEENDTLNRFAELLHIDEARANTLLDEVEADLSAGRAS